MDKDEFAARRKRRLRTADDEMRSLVRAALEKMPAKGWRDDIIEGASVLWLEAYEEASSGDSAAALENFQSKLRESLGMTKEQGPRGTALDTQVERIVKWIGTYTVNSAVFHASKDNGAENRWVTMHDDDVRPTHVLADGQIRGTDGTFDIGGHQLRYPGEPVGPPEVWINCRCMLQPGGNGTSMSKKVDIAFTNATPEVFAVLLGDEDEDIETVPTDDAPEAEVEEDDEADIDELLEIPVHGVAAPLGVATGDGRMFAVDGMNFRDLPLPLAWQKDASHGGEPGPTIIVGKLTALWIDENNMVQYKGWLSPHVPETGNLVQAIVDGTARGVSVDVDDIKVQVPSEDERIIEDEAAALDSIYNPPVTVFSQARIAGLTIVPIPAFQEAYIALGECDCPEEQTEENHDELDGPEPTEEELVAAGFAPGTKDGPGWITDPVPTARIRRYWVRGKGAAKIKWGVPGDFNRCRTQLAKYIKNPDWLAGACANMHKEAIGVWPGQENGGKHAANGRMFALVASAGNTAPPTEWFQNPSLTQITPLTITDDGRIFGHLATWGTCHIGVPGVCTTPPTSPTSYSYFRTGAVRTAEGRDVSVGHITMGTGHAKVGTGLSANAAAAHYDNTGTVVADVSAGEDSFGIWVAGSLREGLSPKTIKALRGAALSGDWRMIQGALEMVAALAVNVPGFPIPRLELAASAGEQLALVASGVVTHESEKDSELRLQVRQALRAEREREAKLERARRHRALAAQTANEERAARLTQAKRHAEKVMS